MLRDSALTLADGFLPTSLKLMFEKPAFLLALHSWPLALGPLVVAQTQRKRFRWVWLAAGVLALAPWASALLYLRAAALDDPQRLGLLWWRMTQGADAAAMGHDHLGLQSWVNYSISSLATVYAAARFIRGQSRA
jgi:hypothetical protein